MSNFKDDSTLHPQVFTPLVCYVSCQVDRGQSSPYVEAEATAELQYMSH